MTLTQFSPAQIAALEQGKVLEIDLPDGIHLELCLSGTRSPNEQHYLYYRYEKDSDWGRVCGTIPNAILFHADQFKVVEDK